MRKIILLVINILIITSSLLSQNAIDPSVLPNNLCRLNSSVINRNISNFTIGWNNGTRNKILDSILKINFSNHVWPKNILKFWASLPVINNDYQDGRIFYCRQYLIEI